MHTEEEETGEGRRRKKSFFASAEDCEDSIIKDERELERGSSRTAIIIISINAQ